jgi:catechol 2,3-dioxygenase-like lactoylglutathione lyase family enzyme
MGSPQSNQPGLGPITCVTFTAPDLAAVEDAYSRFLDYRVVQRGQLSATQADAWNCPADAGTETLLMAPAAADDFLFRVVESPAVDDYLPFGSFGWNAAEIIVRDVDALAERLVDSAFEIVGAPQDLSFSEDIRAMQILGPGRELLYLTQFKRAVPGLDVPDARCDVDRTFIVILGGPSMDALQDFYADRFQVPRAAAVESRVKGMSAAFGLDPEHRYPIAALPLAGQCLIEVDQMPDQAKARQGHAGRLPPGISVVSFASAVTGSEAGSLVGAAGEIIELDSAGR